MIPQGVPGKSVAERVPVLLVDDEPKILEAYERSLRSQFDVTTAMSADEAIGLLEQDRTFAAVLTDLKMPGTDGIGLLLRAREMTPDTVRILVSGHLGLDSMLAAINKCEVFRCLSKPCPSDVLMATLLDAARQHEKNVDHHEEATREARLSQALLLAPDPVLILDASGKALFCNAAAASFFNVDAETMQDTVLGIPISSNDETSLIDSTSGRTAEMRATQIQWHGEPCWMLILRDVTEQLKATRELGEAKKKLEQANQELYHKTVVDPLTMVLNRRGFETKLWEEVARWRRYGNRPSAVLIDCDDFKAINTQYGHGAGDIALKHIADRIKTSIRETDVVARIGGDEFLVLLPETRQAEGMIVAEKIRKTVSSTSVQTPTGSFDVSISAGVASLNPETASIGDVLHLLKDALTSGKVTGRKPIASAEQVGPNSPAPAKMLERGFFEVFTQPILDLSNGKLLGHECFCRGTSEGFEEPTRLFRIAQQAGVLTDVDIHCFGLIIEKTASLRPRHYHCNIFPSTLLDARGAELAGRISSSPNATFCFELSEQEFVGDVNAMRDAFLPLRNKGVYLAIKDIGFGGQTLEALLCLEPDFVRVSKDSLGGLGETHIRRRSWSRLLQVSRAIGAKIVAEGIEKKEDAELLEDLGVQYGQGFYFGKPKRIE